MRRALIMACVPAGASAIAWARLEQDAHWLAFAAAAGAGLVLGVVPGAHLRLVATLGGALAVSSAALSSWPRANGSWLGELGSSVLRGLQDADVVQSPYVAATRPELHALLLIAVFGFAAALAAAAAARRPLLCSAIAVLAVGWPAATLAGSRPVATGAAALAVALWPPLLAAARAPRSLVIGAGAAIAVVFLASAAAVAGAKPSESAVTWRTWDVFGPPSSASAVKVIWDSNYSGIEFPARKTTVLRIRAPREAHYWRASTLDRFTADRWLESLYPVVRGAPGSRMPDDPLLPAEAIRRAGWVKQEIEVAALVDDHIVAAGQPTRIESDDVEQLFFLSGGVMRAQRALVRGQRYTVWSHAPTPRPEALLEEQPRYPAALDRYLELDRTVLPSFGETGREAAVDALLRNDQYPALWPYRGVWEQAARLTQGMTSPYEATVAIEGWLRGTSFLYEENPPPPAGLPPLADFVVRTKQGYCQQFAGAMALMLRFLGIPARVAVGFTSGTWKEGVWTVTDREAHAWVEVWFEGYGWLPFDPTPGRGTLSADYTLASDSADAVAALGTGRFLTTPSFDSTLSPSTPDGGPLIPPESSGRWRWALLASALALSLGVGATKSLRRRRRYMTRDPRRLAVAARAEVVDFVRDQGVEIRAGAGVVEIRRAVESQIGVSARDFAETFSRARYGPADASTATAARRDAQHLLQALRARLGPTRRVRGYFALRSFRRT